MARGGAIMRILRGGRVESSGYRARRGLVVANILGAMLSLLLGVSALAACAPSQPTIKTATATATANPTPAPRLVYQADWSHGLSGWMATPGWTVSDGVLVSDTGADRQITSPFRPTTPNYAVEFHLQLISVAQNVGTE